MSTSFPDTATLRSVLDVAARAPSSGTHEIHWWRYHPGAQHPDRPAEILGMAMTLHHLFSCSLSGRMEQGFLHRHDPLAPHCCWSTSVWVIV